MRVHSGHIHDVMYNTYIYICIYVCIYIYGFYGMISRNTDYVRI